MAFFLYEWPPFWAILFISLVITLVTTLVYKWTTDQKRMRELKEKSKKFQEKMRAARDDPEKMMKVQSEAMKVNLELMKHSLRPTLYTFLPIIILFWWLNAHLAYYNIAPQQPFTITAEFADGIAGNATIAVIPAPGVTLQSNATQEVVNRMVVWNLTATNPGTYQATFSFGGVQIEKQFLITTERNYQPPAQVYKGAIETVTVGNRPVRPFGDDFNVLGWHPGWLATYIILSILLSLGLRKVLNVV